MARILPPEFEAIETSETGTNRAITTTAESVLALNGHYLYGYHRPMQINTTFRGDIDGASGVQPYVIGRNASSAEVSALWCIEPPGEPFTHWSVYILAENTSTTDAATARFDLESDPHPGTSVDIAIPASTTAWTQIEGALEIDNTQTVETIRMWAINGASGQLRVHSVMVVPRAPFAIPAGVYEQNGHPFVPIDYGETMQDAPLSVRLRTRAHNNFHHIWRNRPGTVVAFSEATGYRSGSQGFFTTSADYENAIRLPIRVPRDTERLRWSVFSRVSGSGSGEIRLRTASGDLQGDSPQTVTAVSSYTSPYNVNLHTYASTGKDALTTYPKAGQTTTQDELIVDIKSDGSNQTTLIGLCVWFEKVSA